MEKLNLFPLCYFPPVSWFALAGNEEKLLIEVKEHYTKQKLTNRMRIQTANGVLPLIIPVLRTGERKPIQEKKISYDTDWQKIHWKSLESAYRRSPYFEFYEHKFLPLYQKKTPFLLDFNLEILNLCLEILKTPKGIQLTESYQEADCYNKDYRQAFDPSGNAYPEEFTPSPYTQVFGDFIPDLSVFDLICNEGPASLGVIKKSVRG